MALLQKWDDEDVTGALEWLQEQLTANIQLLSSFEKYKKEVLSGSLDWTPMHTSQQVRSLIAVHGFICVQRMSVESTTGCPGGSQNVCARDYALLSCGSGGLYQGVGAHAQPQMVDSPLQELLSMSPALRLACSPHSDAAAPPVAVLRRVHQSCAACLSVHA